MDEFIDPVSGSDDLVRGLTAAQREAVEHRDGPLMILAGPGSGKTRVVTHRVANLIRHGVPPSRILALTFTNKAANEMRTRLETLLPGRSPWMGTFHACCARWLRRYAPLVGLAENFTIYDMADATSTLKQAIASAGVSTSHVSSDAIAKEISSAKSSLVTPETYAPRRWSELGTTVQRVYPVYQRQLLQANAADFDDLLLHVALLLREQDEVRAELDERFRYILVDEYQDTNFAQYAIVRGLSRDYPNLAVTGDPDQSIYGWRGANLNNILEFEHDFPTVKVVRLEQNFRSTKRILRVADQLISNNKQRKPKTLFTDNDDGAPVRLVRYTTSREEADNVVAQIELAVRNGGRRPRDFAIFYRVNALSRAFEDSLRAAGLPYQIVRGVEFYQRKEIKDILAYLHLLSNPRSAAAFRRIINTPPRQIGAATLNRLETYAEQQRCSLLDAARAAANIAGLGKRAVHQLSLFVQMCDRLSQQAAGAVEEIVGRVLSETKYQEWLEASEDADDLDRLENIRELLTAAQEFDARHADDHPLDAFLQQVALVNDIDGWETESDLVSLMTLHAAKGLEFPVVYLVAVEEGLLPHSRSRENPAGLEEERRLLFVGLTRAKVELQISHAANRFSRGGSQMTVPSSFLLELPRGDMETHQPRASAYQFPAEGDFDGVDDDPGDDEAVFARDDDADSAAPLPNHRPPSLRTPSRRAAAARAVAVPSCDSRKLLTAAQLLAAADASSSAAEVTGAKADEAAGSQDGGVLSLASVAPCGVEDFHHGMLVSHPEYGVGKIVALRGVANKRTATVQFLTSSRTTSFVLAYSQLSPVKAN